MKNELIKTYYSNGGLKTECNYIIDLEANQLNDKRNGLYKKYYSNGQLYIECNYINDKRTGLYKKYNHNGKLEYLSYDIDNVEYYLKYSYKNGFTIMI